MVMSDFGADVIKVERAEGDAYRRLATWRRFRPPTSITSGPRRPQQTQRALDLADPAGLEDRKVDRQGRDDSYTNATCPQC